MSERPIIVWFRNDLRLSDHPAVSAAAATGRSIVPVFILDDEAAGQWARGAASRWWLHHSLTSIAGQLSKLGTTLILRRGATADHLAAIAAESGADTIYFSRAYEPWAAALEQTVKATLEPACISLKRYAGALLVDPEAIETKTGGPYKVYTPFWRALSQGPIRTPLAAPTKIAGNTLTIVSDRLEDWSLLPDQPDWASGFVPHWQPGEAGAHARLSEFLNNAVGAYHDDRNRPDRASTSRLSPHLHFGEITPAQCWAAASHHRDQRPGASKGVETFVKEVVWREFAYHLLHHWPDLPSAPFRPEFAAFPWREDADALKSWQRGQTGYPIVDAGMRELWQTGWMHNRVRMIVASFLIKDLLIPWQQGEAWFWDCLVDADLASNAASWQWVAGSGADAAPYFRIFNPITQGKKFDPGGDYVRRYVPELARLPTELIHAPWEAPALVLKAADIELGKTYPLPIVDHAKARDAALAAYERIKKT